MVPIITAKASGCSGKQRRSEFLFLLFWEDNIIIDEVVRLWCSFEHNTGPDDKNIAIEDYPGTLVVCESSALIGASLTALSLALVRGGCTLISFIE